VLIKRTWPGQVPYWTTPGGGVEPTDTSAEAALHRELAEELGATARIITQVFANRTTSDHGITDESYFLARLITIDLTARTGPEFDDPSRGRYEVDHVNVGDDTLAAIDLRPAALKMFLLANQDAMLGAAVARRG
jgi:8-oxo-dGTP pyrophosphatase MutT (NUDIX family)